MVCASRFAIAIAIGFLGFGLGVGLAHGPAAAAEPAKPAAAQHSCLNQKERRAAVESGKLIRLSAAMHTARNRMPGTVVRARLCHGTVAGQDDLVYVLTVLAHDGKVARIAVDAVKGTLVGGL